MPEQNKRTVRTASLWQARQPVYSTSVARWRRCEPLARRIARIAAAETGMSDEQA